ncbi:Signal transduction histidine-protein kinase AtoS [Zhongshania aliphaticivorans]|uniref:histidine kinase n=1 Tax=Zhongshania aliphaticivorans TaxID=1470434 RepID=A0A5S9QAS9_9GAMM|nr:ATP-binding protein [Zhongshania aliphaticivorans]CAA0114813.1 Signal transduction histidine-protein kinase AtoS [Zhongshania aliphaticivorans]CAA0123031.1 Signal transduction histidine-protein kinase AtoS [Zhongshania aliphaticivorans]
MPLSLNTLFLIGIGYLLLLFAIAYATERQLLPSRLVNHPSVYVLSLGVYASGFAIYGAIGFADRYGYSFLNYYIGISAALILLPILLAPLHQICKSYRLNSLADLLSFRFRSSWVGSIATLFLALAVWPLLAIQIKIVSDSTLILSVGDALNADHSRFKNLAALLFCVVITVFTILFGSRNLASKDSHRGLVVALAFESIVKMLAIVLIGIIAVNTVFGGFGGLQEWLNANPQIVNNLSAPQAADTSRLMLIMFFAASVCMPHVFHMLFAENPSRQNLVTASWGLPLFLLIISAPVLPILWAGKAAGLDITTSYFALGLSLNFDNLWLTTLIYLGGLSAASGAIIVTTLALASMSLNHIVLPVLRPKGREVDIYRWLLMTRQLLICAIILIAFVFYEFIGDTQTLTSLTMASACGCLQFLPGVLAVLYWPRANRNGFISGLSAGFVVWGLGLLLPMFSDYHPAYLEKLYPYTVDRDLFWVIVASLSLGINSLLFIIVSIFSETSSEERSAAEACTLDDLNRPSRHTLNLQTAGEIKQRLQEALGDHAAEQEFRRALDELQLSELETRPYALRRIRDRIEINLSSLVGPSSARRVIDRVLPYTDSVLGNSEDITYIEERLERYQTNLTGLAADLDSLRRYHRQTLEDLPIGVCALGNDQEILLWNTSMADITAIKSNAITGSRLTGLPGPWAACLINFLASSDLHRSKFCVETEKGLRWLNLHRTESQMWGRDELIIVVEDITDTQLLEHELTHQERLASIGRLAAGVAHEIGNPVTGIACLAQNLRYDTENPDTLEAASQIVKQTQRISSIVHTLVNFAHTGREVSSQITEAVSIRNCVSEAIQLLSLDNEARQILYSNLCPESIIVDGDNQKLMQVFINLLSNARDASNENATIAIDARIENDETHITVTDQGSGIDQKLQSRIFEPFFTTKDPGKGTGLGLALVYNIINDIDGEVSIESPVMEFGTYGTRIHIRLPLSKPEPN